MKKLFEEIIDLDQAPGEDTKSHMYGVLANSTISNLFFFSYNWQIPLTYVTSQNPHKTHTVWMKDTHGKKKYSNGSMPHGSKLAMLVEWKQPRLQVSLLPFSKEKSLGTRVQWNRCS